MNQGSTNTHRTPLPALPPLLVKPLRLLPDRFHGEALVRVLNQVFEQQLAAGELDFLSGRTVQISVTDTNVAVTLTLKQGRLRPCFSRIKPEVTVETRAYGYLLLALQREDPDTLFFARQLNLRGDTELGLAVKNFLAAQTLPVVLERFLSLAERVAAKVGRRQ